MLGCHHGFIGNPEISVAHLFRAWGQVWGRGGGGVREFRVTEIV